MTPRGDIPPRSKIIAIIYMLIFLNLCSCQIYKMDLRQGNELTPAKLNQLKPRMTKQEVQAILGIASLTPLSPNRLDYYFTHKINNAKTYSSTHLILYFDKNEELNHYAGDFKLQHLPRKLEKN